ncbi:hypothetical protein IM41_03155 [Fervidobacterium sp. SC_NGM5_G05]|nr:hypothetical protein IM41_03155 [Fervidobacterium sp. SC_NGM5_G05]
MLGHLEDFEETDSRYTLTYEQYMVLEKEADAFASELLAPIALLKNIKNLSPNKIQDLCNVSSEASIYIYDNIKTFGHLNMYTDVEHLIKQRFFALSLGKAIT